MVTKQDARALGGSGELGRRVAAYSIAASATLVFATDVNAVPVDSALGPVTLRAGETLDVDIDGDRDLDYFIRGHNYVDGVLFDIVSHSYEDPATQDNLVAHTYEGGRDLGVTVFNYHDRIGPDTTGWEATGVLFETDGGSGPFLDRAGFIGLFFDIPGGSFHFGYLELEGRGDTLTVRSGAFESEPATAITVAVPEPGSLALLASGAGALLAWRLSRKGGRRG